MEVLIFNPSTIKIKGKQSSLILDPVNSKTTAGKLIADAVLITDEATEGTKVEESRIVIAGPGEYEVGGIKVSGIGIKEELVYVVRIDSIDICIAKTAALEKLHDKVKECQIVLLQADTLLSGAVISSLAPRMVILYGEKAIEVAKGLGKGTESSEGIETGIKPVQKVQTTSDKLPTEMEVVVLG